MVFHALTFARSRGRFWKPRPEAAVFNTSQGTWRMLMHWKSMFDRYYCIKPENICNISRYFLHYFVLPFHQYLMNAISTDYARFRARQYTSRRPGGRGFNPRWGRQHSFVEIDHEIFSTVIIDHEIFSTVILSLPLIQEGQLSVSGERMCTILVNRLED